MTISESKSWQTAIFWTNFWLRGRKEFFSDCFQQKSLSWSDSSSFFIPNKTLHYEADWWGMRKVNTLKVLVFLVQLSYKFSTFGWTRRWRIETISKIKMPLLRFRGLGILELNKLSVTWYNKGDCGEKEKSTLKALWSHLVRFFLTFHWRLLNVIFSAFHFLTTSIYLLSYTFTFLQSRCSLSLFSDQV